MATGSSYFYLTRDDAEDVYQELFPARDHSHLLGLKLKLPRDVVEDIHFKCDKPSDQLRRVVDEVLSRRESTLT